MKKLFLIVSVLFFTNCSNDTMEKDLSNSPNLKNRERVSFDNFEAFNKQIGELSLLSSDELSFWINENNSNSLLNKVKTGDIDDSTLKNLPDAIIALFNSDGELIIGNKIVWLDNGSLFQFNIENEKNLKELKSDINNLEPIGKIELSYQTPKTQTDPNISGKVILNAGNHTDARHQHEFLASQILLCNGSSINSGGIYKYVHEIFTVRLIYNYNLAASVSYLYLRIKLEWYKGRHKWGVATEGRIIETNLNIVSYLQSPNGIYVPTTHPYYNGYNLNNTYFCSSDQTILLNSTNSTYYTYLNPQWHVTISGTIKHSMGGQYPPSGPGSSTHPGLNTWVNNAVW